MCWCPCHIAARCVGSMACRLPPSPHHLLVQAAATGMPPGQPCTSPHTQPLRCSAVPGAASALVPLCTACSCSADPSSAWEHRSAGRASPAYGNQPDTSDASAAASWSTAALILPQAWARPLLGCAAPCTQAGIMFRAWDSGLRTSCSSLTRCSLLRCARVFLSGWRPRPVASAASSGSSTSSSSSTCTCGLGLSGCHQALPASGHMGQARTLSQPGQAPARRQCYCGAQLGAPQGSKAVQ